MPNIYPNNWKTLPQEYSNVVLDALNKKSYLAKLAHFAGFMKQGTGLRGVITEKVSRPEADWVGYTATKPESLHVMGERVWSFEELAYIEPYYLADKERFGYDIERIIKEDMPYAFSKALDKTAIGSKAAPAAISRIIPSAAIAGNVISLAAQPVGTTLAELIQGQTGAVGTLLDEGYTADGAIFTKGALLGLLNQADSFGNPSGQITNQGGIGRDDLTVRLNNTGLSVEAISGDIFPNTLIVPTTPETTLNATAGLAILGIVGRWSNLHYMLEQSIKAGKFDTGTVGSVNLLTDNAEAYRFSMFAALSISLAKDCMDGAASVTEFPFVVVTA